jgi:type II secretory pathway pseudopilin PulG
LRHSNVIIKSDRITKVDKVIVAGIFNADIITIIKKLNKMKAQSLPSSSRNGFSLFEVLMFIAVIGVLAGIMIPLLSPNSDYTSARDRRNAQELSMVFTAAQIAGLNLEGSDLESTIKNVIKGGSPSSGVLKDHHFAVRSLAEKDIPGAANYLSLSGGHLIYSGENKVASPNTLRTASTKSDPPQTPNTVVSSAPPLAPKVVWTLQDSSQSQAASVLKRASL